MLKIINKKNLNHSPDRNEYLFLFDKKDRNGYRDPPSKKAKNVLLLKF